jgi:hypothetical protein
MDIIHYPNLKTILMVEEVLKTQVKPVNREGLKRRLPREIMHQTLNVILSYLEDSGKIKDERKGISWIKEIGIRTRRAHDVVEYRKLRKHIKKMIRK